MNISFDVNFWVVLFAALNFSITASVAQSNRRKAASDELKAVQVTLQKELRELEDKVWRRIGSHSERISVIEAEIKNQITDDDIAVVHRRVDALVHDMGEVKATVNRTDGRLEEMSKTLESIRLATMRNRDDYPHAR
jgi:hypothetical protein